MSNFIFFYNDTNVTFNLYDADNNFFGTINAIEYCSFKLRYSSTFQKQYNFIQSGQTDGQAFWLDINGELIRVAQSVDYFFEIGSVNPPGPRNLLTINYVVR